ncbi:MAG: hypothetical protein BGO55_04470 [Sphingobacteriales bacterium 50-39]|nr:SusD/RagB family nutrient-binding outer membrane lipoprotein [Sphingobacteriales bacterium]OJW55878.1 MAG: hypothetical protein BGO55_04470 [Sphingobacteriales bacterium 50-39]
MKRILLYYIILLIVAFSACSKSKFGDYYQNPASTSTTTIEKQWTGFNYALFSYESFQYYPYFVEWQTTALNFTQATAYVNVAHRYEPVFQYASIDDKWNNYYNFLSQYKNFVAEYSSQPAATQNLYRIFKITADIHFYDQTQKMVDTYGDIPWSKAGLITTNGGNVSASYASYDKAPDIYATMLDSLKAHATELNALSGPNGITSTITTIFNHQDFINQGSILKWQKYCNSLRIKMLMRVSGTSQFGSRANTEIASILSDPATYPICNGGSTGAGTFGSASNGYQDGIYVTPPSSKTAFTSSLYSGLIGWGNGDRATKVMIDTLVNNSDPRLNLLFQPGPGSPNTFIGLDESLDGATQSSLLQGTTIAGYNYNISNSSFLPMLYITSQEIQLLLADYYTNIAPNSTLAGQAYTAAITNSINWYSWLYSISDNTKPIYGSYTYSAPTSAAISGYINGSNMSWATATTTAQQNELIGLQKWINYNVFQPNESWAELRRTGYPTLNFVTDDASNVCKQPATRFYYPVNEVLYNTTNYNAATNSGATNIPTKKVFWQH